MELKIDKEHRMNDSKMLWHMDRVKKYFDEGKRIPPILMDVGATKFCNIRCVYCIGQYQKMSSAQLSKRAIVDLFETSPKIGIKAIALIGDGEPTLNPHIYEAMNAGKNNGLDICTTTNGVLLDDDDKIRNVLRNCTWMKYSLSAGTREGYKEIHRVDKFDTVVRNIERMVELKEKGNYKCEVGLQSVYVPGLMDKEMIEESKLAIRLGVDHFLIKQCSLPEKNNKVADVKFEHKQYLEEKIIETLKECESMSTEKTKIIPKWVLMNQEQGNKPYESCLASPFLPQISGNGKMYPCGRLFINDKYLMGDIEKQSIKEIIESERYWEVIDMMKKFKVDVDCVGCCRQDKINEFCDEYVNTPKGVNFI